MENFRPLVSKPGGPYGYFWTIWGDWGLVSKVGLGFVLIVCLVTFLSQYPEIDNQKKSFAIALTSLAAAPLAQPLPKLLKTKNLYSWRAIVWLRYDNQVNPWIWRVDILKEGKDFRIVDQALKPYEREQAESLELFDKVGPE